MREREQHTAHQLPRARHTHTHTHAVVKYALEVIRGRKPASHTLSCAYWLPCAQHRTTVPQPCSPSAPYRLRPLRRSANTCPRPHRLPCTHHTHTHTHTHTHVHTHAFTHMRIHTQRHHPTPALPHRLSHGSMELWRDLLVDFMAEFMGGKPAVLVGNSIGALACLMVRVARCGRAGRGRGWEQRDGWRCVG